MTFRRFEDIIAWQKSQDLAVEVYQKFRSINDFSFRDQICRASVSISNNIAEGFGRKGDKQFKHFLYIGLGSAMEVNSMLYLAEKLRYITKEEAIVFHEKGNEVCRLIRGLIKSLND